MSLNKSETKNTSENSDMRIKEVTQSTKDILKTAACKTPEINKKDKNKESWDELVSQEDSPQTDTYSQKDNNKKYNKQTHVSEHIMENSRAKDNQDNLDLSLFSKENPYAQTSQDKTAQPKQWSSLFTKLKRGKSTYTAFSPRDQIKSKNDNALIVEVQHLQSSFNEIMASLYEEVKQDIIAAKQHFKRGSRSHLEIIFTNKEKLKHYAINGIKILNYTYFGYIPTDLRKSFLSVKLRNVQLGDKDIISSLIKEAFEDIGQIASIKPLLIEGTPYLTDQWLIIFETTEDPELEGRIPRFTHLGDNKISTEWKSAPKVCYFCDQEGHIKQNCSQFQESLALRTYFRKLKEETNIGKKKDSADTSTPKKELVVEKPQILEEITAEEPLTIKETTIKEKTTEQASNEEKKEQKKTASKIETKQQDSLKEDIEILRDELTLEDPFSRMTNKENIAHSEEPSSMDLSDTEFTTVINKKKKNKKIKPILKQEQSRSAPYKKHRLDGSAQAI
jgi:hypothetical protein